MCHAKLSEYFLACLDVPDLKLTQISLEFWECIRKDPPFPHELPRLLLKIVPKLVLTAEDAEQMTRDEKD
jgi:hypothetical protein